MPREADDLLAGSADAPVAHYVNVVLLEAVKRGASDIHIEPFANALAVRYRIDGLLYEQPSPPRHLESALTARLKVMAKLDLAEKRLRAIPLLDFEPPKVDSYYITRSPSTIPADLEEELLADCSYGLQGNDHGRHDDDGQEAIK